jgi:NAD(P)-dependent dehydrogenase (short-subunit alcohol dehydrogenase family)
MHGRGDPFRHSTSRPGADSARFSSVVLQLSQHDPWTVNDAFQGTQIFGATGSGKTSGSGQAIARRFIEMGFGGLVLAATPDELARWAEYAADARALDRLIVLTTPERHQHHLTVAATEPSWRHEAAAHLRSVKFAHRFDPLEYELHHGATGPKVIRNVVSLFLAALSSGEASVSRAEPYWTQALEELLTHAFDLLHFAAEPVRLSTVSSIVRTAAQSRDEARSASWRSTSECHRLLLKAYQRKHEFSDEERADWLDTFDYWTEAFPSLADRTRSSIVSTFTTKATGLLRRPLRSLLGITIDGHVRPERCRGGSIIVFDLPTKVYGEAGRLAQVLYKTVWQRAMERPAVSGSDPKPVFLWADEAQHFVTPEDRSFQQTARGNRVATVYLTQNLPNYYAVIGGDRFQAETESLLGNLQTKFFHANGDPVTNEYAERVFGRTLVPESGYSIQGDSFSESSQDQERPIVRASEFTTLKQGGEVNDYEVEAFVFQGGRPWKTPDARANGFRVAFDQNTGMVKRHGKGPSA